MNEQPTESEVTLAFVRSFIDSVGRHDVDGVLAHMTEDAVYENLGHDVDSGRHEGQAAVRSVPSGLRRVSRLPVRHGRHLRRRESLLLLLDDAMERGRRERGVSHGTDIFTLRDGKISYKKTYE